MIANQDREIANLKKENSIIKNEIFNLKKELNNFVLKSQRIKEKKNFGNIHGIKNNLKSRAL